MSCAYIDIDGNVSVECCSAGGLACASFAVRPVEIARGVYRRPSGADHVPGALLVPWPVVSLFCLGMVQTAALGCGAEQAAEITAMWFAAWTQMHDTIKTHPLDFLLHEPCRHWGEKQFLAMAVPCREINQHRYAQRLRHSHDAFVRNLITLGKA